jgi:hypothetical protein
LAVFRNRSPERQVRFMQALPSPLSLRQWLVLLPALCCLSCSSNSTLYPVQGKVLHNNQPAKGAVVTFHPVGVDEVKAIRTTGLTREDGTFTLTTSQQEGAPAGEYEVTFIWPEEVARKGKMISTEPPDTRDRLQGAYADRRKSKLKVEIKKGPNQLEPFHLK